MKIKRNLGIEVYDNKGNFMRFIDSNKPLINWSDLSEVEKFAAELEQSGDYNEVYIVSYSPSYNSGIKILRRWNKRYGNY